MSYGWLTESALVPRQSKRIKVSDSSMTNLKLAMYEHKKDYYHHEDKSKSSRPLQNASSTTQKRKRLRDPMHPSYKNKGIEERQTKDEHQRDDDDAQLDACKAKLEQKAKIYQAIKEGSIKNSVLDASPLP